MDGRPAATSIIERLGLSPLPGEGGWFRRTWERPAEPSGAGRAAATSILYLVTPGGFSAFHRLDADELYHFHAGLPAEHLQLLPGGRFSRHVVGPDALAGHDPQVVCPAGAWQATRPLRDPGQADTADGDRDWSLLGCTMSPGFDPGGFEVGSRAALCSGWPGAAAWIEALTRA